LNILITGICGFVGSTIAMAWRNAYPGDAFIGVDNLSRSGAWVNREKLQKAGVKVVHGTTDARPTSTRSAQSIG
jgi:CDP-paratose 2-epimerase